jgi:hypothetical protein
VVDDWLWTDERSHINMLIHLKVLGSLASIIYVSSLLVSLLPFEIYLLPLTSITYTTCTYTT